MTTPFAPLSSSLGSRLLAGVGALALLGSIGLMSSRPARTAGGPIPVTVSNTIQGRDVDNAARQPFQIGLSFVSTNTDNTATFTVPAGKQLVLENVSALVFTNDSVAEVIVATTVAGQTVSHQVGFATTMEHSFRIMPVVPVRLYADGGSTVTVSVERNTPIPVGTGLGNNVKLSGYLVDLP